MSIGLGLDLRDNLSPVVARLRGGIGNDRLGPVIGRAAVNAYRKHFFGLNAARPNRLGGKRTNYYAQAGRGTQYQVVPDGVLVSINQIGIRSQYYGGTIRAKKAKFLTIPVHPAAHGKTAREFDLEVVFGPGGRPIALATKGTLRREITQTATGRIRSRNVGRRGEIYFLLKQSITKQPDPSVLMTPADLAGAIIPEARSYLERLIDRQAN